MDLSEPNFLFMDDLDPFRGNGSLDGALSLIVLSTEVLRCRTINELARDTLDEAGFVNCPLWGRPGSGGSGLLMFTTLHVLFSDEVLLFVRKVGCSEE